MATALDYCPSSYSDCSAVLPDLAQSNCLSVGLDLIDAILLAQPNAPGFSASDYATVTALATAISSRLLQTGQYTSLTGFSGDAAIRKWNTYNATKPFVEPTLVTVRPGLQVGKRTTKTIEGIDYDNSIANHNWHKLMNCYRTVKGWPLAGSFMYGGQNGITFSFVSYHGIVDSNDGPCEGWTYRLSYLTYQTEDKCVRPGIV